MNSTAPLACMVCGNTEELMRCSRCREAFYCSKEHQKQDWKNHKTACQNNTQVKNKRAHETTLVEKIDSQAIIDEGSSETEILNECAQNLSPNFDSNYSDFSTTQHSKQSVSLNSDNMLTYDDVKSKRVREYPEVSFPPYLHNKNSYIGDNSDQLYQLSVHVVEDMNKYGMCVLDDFLGKERGMQVFREVLDMYKLGIFKDGQLVSSSLQSKNIRGDKITWIDGTEEGCFQISQLIHQVDSIIMRANKMPHNGKMGEYSINGRTKAMVACYPGSGTHYVKHVDNPNKDGRCITAIYYLNIDWDIKTCGGLLRIFPEGCETTVADIEPKFDRVLFFWSDRRNPHEVQASFKTRFAITLWYFDAVERREATKRHREKAALAQHQPK